MDNNKLEKMSMYLSMLAGHFKQTGVGGGGGSSQQGTLTEGEGSVQLTSLC
jgi:hypothetical protein